MSTHSAAPKSSMMKISWSTSGESSTTIMTSVWGLKYVPGRIVSSSSWKRRASLMARLYPTVRPTCSPVELLERSGHLGLHRERLEPLPHAPFIARDDELAHLLGEARLGLLRAGRLEQARD